MSKINVDEIQVGDLVEYQSPHFDYIRALGVVTNIDGEQGLWGYWSDEDQHKECRVSCIENIVGHWKVINFADGSYKCSECGRTLYAKNSYAKGVCAGCVKTEEGTKMDELKVYTGKETIEALLEGKTLKYRKSHNQLIKYESNQFMTKDGDSQWRQSLVTANGLLTIKMTEVVTPQVGDWVRYNFGKKTYTGEVKKINKEGYWGEWNKPTSDIITPIYPYEHVTFEILSPEQVSEYKREQAFAKVGRKLNEFRSGDIVLIESTGDIAVVVSKENEKSIRLHVINVERKGYDGKPTQLKPIAFTEQQVDLS